MNKRGKRNQVKFYADDITLQNLDRQVKRSKISTTRSNYLRNLINRRNGLKSLTLISKRYEINTIVIRSIYGACNNINQIAKRLNSRIEVPIDKVEDNLITMNKLLNENLTELQIQNTYLSRFL